MADFNLSDYAYESWISQFKSMQKLTEQLQFMLTILYSLDGTGQAKFQDNILSFEKIRADHDLMRKVMLRDAIVVENPVEYFGKDFGLDDPFKYDKKLEEQIANISIDIMACLGLVIKYLKAQDFHIGDET